jgi:hypothetical protein
MESVVGYVSFLNPPPLLDGGKKLFDLPMKLNARQHKDNSVKVVTARNLWIPAINNHGGFGRWAFLEISDPWDAQKTIRAFFACQEGGRHWADFETIRVL